MAEPLEKNGKIYMPLAKGTVISPDLHTQAQWGQKTAPTKIFNARAGEDITQASGERKLVMAKGSEVVFDNGFIPLKRNEDGDVVEQRRDIYIPTDSTGKSTGAEIRDRDYTRIGRNVEHAVVPGFNGGETYARDYGVYLPRPNPQPILKLDQPAYIPDAFGPGDHQWLDQPVLRLEQDGDQWKVKGALNGPEFDQTWTAIGPLQGIERSEATLKAEFALQASRRAFLPQHIVDVIKSLPTRFAENHWRSQPEKPAIP